jgi:hypothetical protein
MIAGGLSMWTFALATDCTFPGKRRLFSRLPAYVLSILEAALLCESWRPAYTMIYIREVQVSERHWKKSRWTLGGAPCTFSPGKGDFARTAQNDTLSQSNAIINARPALPNFLNGRKEETYVAFHRNARMHAHTCQHQTAMQKAHLCNQTW